MVRDAIRRVVERYPALARALGDRPEIQMSAITASLLTHGALVLALAMVTYAALPPQSAREFRADVVDTTVREFEKLDTTEMAETDKETTINPVAGSFSPNPSAMVIESPLPPQERKAPDLSKPQIALAAASVAIPTNTRLDQSVSIRGAGSEHVGGVEGAVDRLAVEITRQMERGKTLVVWAFDASGSLQVERQRLAKYIDGVYGHIAELDKEGSLAKGALLTQVVAFGQGRKPMTPQPTDDRQAIVSAIESVPLDATGVESTFATVAAIAEKWGKFSRDGDRYRTLIIVVTDEVGDDDDHLESAIAAARASKTPVYVLGSAALFGRVEGVMDYTDPKTKQTFRNLPVRQGPESVMLEGIRLPFWYDGPQYDYVDAGFGPWALSRLAGATEGIYFVTRMGGHRVQFDPAGMREYRPDWVSRDQYVSAVNSHPIRLAVMKAAQIAQQNLPGTPPLRFPAADTPEFKEAMAKGQEQVARSAYTIDAALEPIEGAKRRRDHEPSRRWQAHYDLLRGRLLAAKIRSYEYNWACAKMKRDPKKFSDARFNGWALQPDAEVHYSDKANEASKEARALLQKVVTDHPGTPWAMLAARELKDPMGLKWVEVTVPPPPKREERPAMKKEATKPMAKPPDPPKL